MCVFHFYAFAFLFLAGLIYSFIHYVRDWVHWWIYLDLSWSDLFLTLGLCVLHILLICWVHDFTGLLAYWLVGLLLDWLTHSILRLNIAVVSKDEYMAESLGCFFTRGVSA